MLLLDSFFKSDFSSIEINNWFICGFSLLKSLVYISVYKTNAFTVCGTRLDILNGNKSYTLNAF